MKKSQLKEMIREVINEELALESQASDDAKKQGLEYMGFGRWGKDGKLTHTTQSGKLVPVKGADGQVDRKLAVPARVHKSPEAQRAANAPKDSLASPSSDSGDRFGKDTNYLQVRKGASPAARKLVGKVSDMFDKAAEQPGFYEKHSNQTYSAAEFEQLTGISPKAAKAFSATVQDYASPFRYDEESDTVDIHDPMDV